VLARRDADLAAAEREAARLGAAAAEAADMLAARESELAAAAKQLADLRWALMFCARSTAVSRQCLTNAMADRLSA